MSELERMLFVGVDLLGTAAFAMSGAAAALERELDLFGVYAVAFVTACGGGILRDLCLGLHPAGLWDWRYLLCSGVAATAAVWVGRWLERPVLVFDAVGLGFFAVVGAQKALAHEASVEAAILLGVLTAVGGGVLRDVLLNRVPPILEKEIYALAALIAAGLQVLAQALDWPLGVSPWLAAGAGVTLRMLALRYGWRLPVLRPR